jgi:hypothetical protein
LEIGVGHGLQTLAIVFIELDARHYTPSSHCIPQCHRAPVDLTLSQALMETTGVAFGASPELRVT